MFGCRASFLEPPGAGDDVPAVRITLADGTSVVSDSAHVDALLSRFFGRDVELAQAAPADFTIDQYHPDIEDADPGGHRDRVVDQRLGSAFFDDAGLPSPVGVGSFFDLFPVSVLTTSTLDRLHELSPASNFDERRFRRHVIVPLDLATTHRGGVGQHERVTTVGLLLHRGTGRRHGASPGRGRRRRAQRGERRSR
jgi:hypothetical protein